MSKHPRNLAGVFLYVILLNEVGPHSVVVYFMRKIIFTQNNYYHIFNRGVDKRQIFFKNSDYIRFIHGLFEFNETNLSINFTRRLNEIPNEPGPHSALNEVGPRDCLVDIVAFCLMPNHFHFILTPLKEEAISKFMQKLSTSYSMFFNIKYERSGTLFQGRFKAVHIENDEQLKHTSRYIHLNPLELAEPKWKENGISDWNKASQFLENYRWSSYLDYIGKNNFPAITDRKFIMDYFDNNKENYKKYVNEWVVDDLEKIDILD